MKCAPPYFEPGGGGINVARAIKKLGGEALAIYLAGGYTGKFFTQLLEKEGVKNTCIETAGHTRENLIVFDNSTSLQYRFGMPGPGIAEEEWKQLLNAIEKNEGAEFIVASGSVPAGVPPDIFARIAAIAKKKKAKFIVDTSGDALKHATDEGVYLLKPNLSELSSLVGKEELNTEQTGTLARTLIEKGNCEIVVVSLGAEGALLVTQTEMHSISPPPVERKSTVGAGDSMVAGIVLSLGRGRSLLESVQYGVACGTAATMNPGTELCKPEDVATIYAAIRGKKNG